MTNKEAKEKIFYQWQDFLEHNLDYAGISDAYNMAIKALEQNDVLQEIRQEIVNNLVKTYPFIDHMDAYVKEDEVLEIIDRYLDKSK